MKKLLFILLFPILVFSQDTISKPQHSIISLDKVKVVYRGIDNPITVAINVPDAKEFWVSGPGVSKTDEIGKYIVRPGSGTELKIVVAVKLENGSTITEEHIYQIKGLPNPTTTINNQFSTQGYLEFSLDELKDADVGVKLLDFLSLNYPFVNGFTIRINGKKVYENEGRILNNEGFNLIKKAKNKDLIIFTNIKWFFSGTSMISKPSTSVVIKIVEK